MVTQRELGGEEAPCLETRNDDGPAEVIAAGADLAVPVPVLMLISLADADAAKRVNKRRRCCLALPSRRMKRFIVYGGYSRQSGGRNEEVKQKDTILYSARF